MNKIGAIIVALAVIANNFASAHTWVSCVNQQGNDCKAYIRGYVGRNTPTAAVDDWYTWKALGRPNDFQLCKPDSQASNTAYTTQYPMATAKAGDTLNIMYTPNGHSQPGDQGTRTTARIHWTGNPNTVLKTRADLNSGNQLASWNYASNCATTGDVASLPCVNGFTIPAGTPTGTYQFVWYWPYDRNQQQVPIGEEYFSCFDVAVTGTTAVQTSTSTSNAQTSTSTSTSNAQTSTSTSNAQTSNPVTPSTAASGTTSDVCATSFANCQSFCAPAVATQCECDPITGKKTVRCAGADDTSSASSLMVGSSVILAAAAVARLL